mmetsp:Transcript_17919/g.31682  ORF Transcript_17919/g.31682 Transcript_17919/m.31682 type:complete len:223 (+) Transcript_17919:1175-1843(+)
MLVAPKKKRSAKLLRRCVVRLVDGLLLVPVVVKTHQQAPVLVGLERVVVVVSVVVHLEDPQVPRSATISVAHRFPTLMTNLLRAPRPTRLHTPLLSSWSSKPLTLNNLVSLPMLTLTSSRFNPRSAPGLPLVVHPVVGASREAATQGLLDLLETFASPSKVVVDNSGFAETAGTEAVNSNKLMLQMLAVHFTLHPFRDQRTLGGLRQLRMSMRQRLRRSRVH